MERDVLTEPGPQTQWVRNRARRTSACLLSTAYALALVLAAVSIALSSFKLSHMS